MNVLYALEGKLICVKPRRTSRGWFDAVTLGNVAAGHVETAGNSRELGHGVLFFRELRSNQFLNHGGIVSLPFSNG